MNDHIDGHYEKKSNGSSYYEAYKRLLTPPPPCKSILRKRKKNSSSHSLSLFFILSTLFSDFFFLIIYQSKIYLISTTLICIVFVLILQHVISTNFSKGNSRILNLKLFIQNKNLHIYIIVDLFCYILLKVVNKLFDFVYDQSYANAIKLL